MYGYEFYLKEKKEKQIKEWTKDIIINIIKLELKGT